MSDVDCFDGSAVRSGKKQSTLDLQKIKEAYEEDLLTISPEIDGRLKDEGRD
jgi:hypothetical protein